MIQNIQDSLNYYRIAEAIDFLSSNYRNQPSLDDVAKSIHLSPTHFQRLFTDWAGTSPKKFLQYLSLDHAKKLLSDYKTSISDAAFETGLSGSSRLHDLFVSVEGMTPADFKNGGKNLTINYSFSKSAFGQLIVASTIKGVCYLAFQENENDGFEELKLQFPNASFHHEQDDFQIQALRFFQNDTNASTSIKLYLKGTPFQLKVWGALLKIPSGDLTTYGMIANEIQQPTASRAVGTAIGNNPVAWIIPCHRVIQATGIFGGYKWGTVRKKAIIGWESALKEGTSI